MDAMQLDSASFHPAIMEMQPEFIHSQGIDDDFILPLLELSAEDPLHDVFDGSSSGSSSGNQTEHECEAPEDRVRKISTKKPQKHLDDTIRRQRKRQADREFRARKRDKIERVCNENEKLEKENADLRRQVSDMQQLLSALPDPVRMSLGGSQHSERMDARRRLVSSILDAFNCGALDRLTRIMDETFHEDCVLLTPAIFEELHGRKAVAKFWTMILEAFPDCVIEAQGLEIEQDGDQVHCRFQFSGTKVAKMPTDVLMKRWKWLGFQVGNTTEVPTRRGTRGRGQEGKRLPTAEVSPVFSKESCNDSPFVSLWGHLIISFREEKVSRLVLLWNTMALLAQMSGVVEQGLLREMQGQTPVTIKSSLLQMREQI